jgi:hypothetical protein
MTCRNKGKKTDNSNNTMPDEALGSQKPSRTQQSVVIDDVEPRMPTRPGTSEQHTEAMRRPSKRTAYADGYSDGEEFPEPEDTDSDLATADPLAQTTTQPSSGSKSRAVLDMAWFFKEEEIDGKKKRVCIPCR